MNKILSLTLLFILPTVSSAAINFDQITNGNSNATVSPASYSVTVSTAPNPILFVSTFSQTSCTAACTTGVTYNGVAMTKLTGTAVRNGTAGAFVNEWYVTGISGTHNVSVSFSGVGADDWSQAISYVGASQGAIDATSTATSNTVTSLTASPTTTQANDWLSGYCSGQTSGPLTPGTGTTDRSDASGQFSTIDSGGIVSGAGSHGLQCTGSSQSIGMIVAAFAAATDASSTTSSMISMPF